VSVPASFWLHGENSSNGETNRFGLWKTCSIENSTDEASNETSEVINCSVTNRGKSSISKKFEKKRNNQTELIACSLHLI